MKTKLLCFLITMLILVGLLGGVFGCAGPAEPSAPAKPAQPEAPEPGAPGEPAPAAPTEVIRLKFSDWDPAVSVFCQAYREPWVRLIERETGGRVVIDVYGAETLVKMGDLYDALLTGISDICLVSPPRTPGRFPLLEISHLPFIFRSSLISGLAMWEANEKGLFQDELKEVKLLGFRPNDVYNIVHRSKYIQTLEDWKGQKCASTGWVQAEMIKLLGAVPVDLGPAESYDALAKGMIDMRILEWEGQWTWRTYEVSKYRTDLADIMIGASTLYAMSRDSYNSLPQDIQEVFDKYSGVWMTELTSANMDRENYWRRTMIEEHDKEVGNPEFYMLPDEERQRWIDALTPLYDDYLGDLEAKGLPARACFDGLKVLSKKYEMMYPPLGDAHIGKMKEYGYEAVYPGWPPNYPAGFEWLEAK